jgi:hypothetical protein
MKLTHSHEYKVAQKMSALITDLRLDVVLVGEYLAQFSPRVAVNRIILMAEVAEQDINNDHDTLY